MAEPGARNRDEGVGSGWGSFAVSGTSGSELEPPRDDEARRVDLQSGLLVLFYLHKEELLGSKSKVRISDEILETHIK